MNLKGRNLKKIEFGEDQRIYINPNVDQYDAIIDSRLAIMKMYNLLIERLLCKSATYVTSIAGFSPKCDFLKYQDVLETISFYFEGYRNEFNHLFNFNTSYLDINLVVFIDCCSQEV